MKSQRRHALRENLLARNLGRAKDALGKYGNWLAGGVLAVVIVLLIVYWYQGRVEREQAQEQTEFNALVSPESTMEERERIGRLQNLAGSARNPTIAAAAAVRLGDIFAQMHLEALRRSDSPAVTRPGVSPAARETRENAERYYNMAIEKHGDQPRMVAQAHFGMGMLLENSGQLDKAIEQFRLTAQTAPPGTGWGADAEDRIRKLETWASQPVKLATTAPAAPLTSLPSPATATAPATGPAR